MPMKFFSGDIDTIENINDITDILLLLALVLFIIDIAIRRLNISFRKLDAVLEKGRNAAYKIKGSVETKLATSKQIKMPEINKKISNLLKIKLKIKKEKEKRRGKA